MNNYKSVTFKEKPEYIPVSKVKYSHTWKKVNTEKSSEKHHNKYREKNICSLCIIL